MSKQSEARAAQQYVASPVLPTCGNCANFCSDKKLPAWMERDKKSYDGTPYTVEAHGVETNLRCGIGGFAVKKMGSCTQFKAKGD